MHKNAIIFYLIIFVFLLSIFLLKFFFYLKIVFVWDKLQEFFFQTLFTHVNCCNMHLHQKTCSIFLLLSPSATLFSFQHLICLHLDFVVQLNISNHYALFLTQIFFPSNRLNIFYECSMATNSKSCVTWSFSCSLSFLEHIICSFWMKIPPIPFLQICAYHKIFIWINNFERGTSERFLQGSDWMCNLEKFCWYYGGCGRY